MSTSIKVGIIGCGNIAPAYMKGCRDFPIIEVVACADLLPERAVAFAQEYGLQALSVDVLLSHPDIQIVINLTIPKVHAEVSMTIIQAGKHVYSEKPLAVNRADGAKILAAAQSAGVLVGCAPDTFLGGGIQTCRKLIDEGAIGQPVAATAFMASHGPESWHPNAEFYYQAGGGPLFDMGPYYLTALVNLLGPIRGVTAFTRKSFSERVATSKARFGEKIQVEVDTHIAGVLDFVSGAVVTMIMSFDMWGHHLPHIEIYGADGSLSVPDPNRFSGPVQVWQPQNREWQTVSHTHSTEVQRGIGVADMAYALQHGRPHRASGALAYHVLDVMQAFGEASSSGQQVTIESTCLQPVPLTAGLNVGELDI